MRYAMILAVCLATPCAAQELQPVPEVQEQINKVANELSQSRGVPHLHAGTAKELKALVELLTDKGEIVKQLAVFATGPSEQHPMMALAILQAIEFPPIVVIRVLAPYLDDENPKLRSFVRDWFQAHDNGGPGDDPLKPVNFEDYVKYVRGQPDPPAPFVEYIYGRSPGRALIVFYRALGQRDAAIAALQAEAREVQAARQGREVEPAAQQPPDGIPLAEQIISHAVRLKNWENGKLLPEAKERLAKLSSHEEWWVRRYVAQIMGRHPELRVAEVLEKLSGDSNESVSKAASVGE